MFFDADALRDDLSAGVALKAVTLLPLQETVDAGEDMFEVLASVTITGNPYELALKAAKKASGEW